MHILVVDTNQPACDALVGCVKDVWPQETVDAFTDPLLALKHGINHPVDVLVAAAEMRGANGQDLTRILRQHHPKLFAVYVTNSPKRRKSDFDIAPDGVVLQPVTEERLRQAIARIQMSGSG